MPNPPGTRRARWDTAVSAIVTATGKTTAEADDWLNKVYASRRGDEVQGEVFAHNQLRNWLEKRGLMATTLARALEEYL